MKIVNISEYGIENVSEVLYNPSYETLYQEEVKPDLIGFEKGVVTDTGAIAVDTGIFTGRSPKDKYIVRDDTTRDNFWWSDQGKNDNNPISTEQWDHFEKLVTNELSGSNSFNASINSVVNEVDVVETDIIDGELKITTNYLDGTYFEFFIPENIQIGSYTLNASTQIYANYVFANGAIASSQYGTLTILEHDSQFKKIKASFLFNTGNPYNVTISDGNFIVYY